MTDILEAVMLTCFGLSWPINVVKNFKAKTVKGMSLRFTMLIVLGYIAGILAKFVSKDLSFVLIIYLINLLIVLLNIPIYFRNKKLDKKANKLKEIEKPA